MSSMRKRAESAFKKLGSTLLTGLVKVEKSSAVQATPANTNTKGSSVSPDQSSKGFPVEALGSCASEAVQIISRQTKAPAGIAAQSVLATASLAVQGHIDVDVPLAGPACTSLYLVTIAESGERKSSCDSRALKPITDFQDRLIDQCNLEAAENDYSPEEKCHAERKCLLLSSEPTFEGLVENLDRGRGSLGLFNDEAGSFIGGYAMSKDKRLATISGLSQIWDGATLNRDRVGGSGGFLRAKRLALHQMIQPILLPQLLTDEVKGQGFGSRLLLAWPESTMGTRILAPGDLNASYDLTKYNDRVKSLLERPLPYRHDSRNDIAPRLVALSKSAQEDWRLYVNDIEAQLVEGGKYRPISGHANKLAENACRVAAVLAAFENPDISELSSEDFERGVEVTRFYAREMLWISEVGKQSKQKSDAAALFSWISTNCVGDRFHLAQVYQKGPSNMRDKNAAMSALASLESTGHIRKLPANTEVDGKRRKDAWEMIKS